MPSTLILELPHQVYALDPQPPTLNPESLTLRSAMPGEYAERIDNAVELMDQFSEQFHDDSAQVQLQILTGVVKLFLKRPKESGTLVKRVLGLATQVRSCWSAQ
jgi:vesicle coat complex subunit